jgi:hypothetical protein
MSKPVRSRRIFALIAAYVVALQALVLPLSVATAAPFPDSLCAASADGSQPVGRHETGCPCAASCGMQCCGLALIGPPQVVVAVALTPGLMLTPAPALEPVVRPAGKGPQIPRAPPAV